MGNTGSKVGVTLIAGLVTGVAGYKGLKSVKLTEELIKEDGSNSGVNKLGILVGAAILAGAVYLIVKDNLQKELQPLKF